MAGVETPTCDVAGEEIDTGSEARCFADWMRVHALEGTGAGRSRRWAATSTRTARRPTTPPQAAKDPKTGQPVTNGARDLWVTQRALATGLELAFVGEQISLFSIATGVVFAIIGIGLLVMLTVGGVLAPADAGRRRDQAARLRRVIDVCVSGAAGRMGRAVVGAVGRGGRHARGRVGRPGPGRASRTATPTLRVRARRRDAAT